MGSEGQRIIHCAREMFETRLSLRRVIKNPINQLNRIVRVKVISKPNCAVFFMGTAFLSITKTVSDPLGLWGWPGELVVALIVF